MVAIHGVEVSAEYLYQKVESWEIEAKVKGVGKFP